MMGEIDEVTNVMKMNLEKIMNREETLFDLDNKSKELEEAGQHFEQTSQKVARSYWWKNAKLIVLIVVVVLIIVLIIILLATGVIPTSAPLSPIVTPTTKPKP